MTFIRCVSRRSTNRDRTAGADVAERERLTERADVLDTLPDPDIEAVHHVKA
ncbi:hypothetical protein ACFXKF_36010 [Streptomyces scopuliridis]|uniref:hypothetical protein n=1 Tax=Streptomyces scopuliridis TaxID=452529 RepID=UPI00368A03DF